MQQTVKIGTRDSELAIWQARKVQSLLTALHVPSELVPIKSEGDINLTQPLYEIGVQGIFTRALDIALLEQTIDVAVHSYKDVPTQLATGIAKAAVLKRDSYKDVLIPKVKGEALKEMLGFANGIWHQQNNVATADGKHFTIATSSIRRKAQWLHRYPGHHIENLRGNVNSRLRKLEESNWQGAIFAAAGLDRINLRPAESIELDWMLPAPAQGAIVVVCRENNQGLRDLLAALNDEATDVCTGVERDFLRALNGGCTTPISALAQINRDELHFKGSLTAADGKVQLVAERRIALDQAEQLGATAAREILDQGGDKIIESIRNGGK